MGSEGCHPVVGSDKKMSASVMVLSWWGGNSEDFRHFPDFNQISLDPSGVGSILLLVVAVTHP